MTAPARISQADIERAARAAKNAGWGSARIIMDLENRRIEIIVGAPAADGAEPVAEWSDDDV